MNPWAIRPAAVSDARDFARINVRTWQAAYRGLLPESYLRSLNILQRIGPWRRRLSEPEAGVAGWVAISPAGKPCGYTIIGPYRDDDLGREAFAELYAIYVEPEHWSSGAGHALMEVALAGMRERGYADAVLWMLEGNERAARFYEGHGWRLDGGTKSEPFDQAGTVLATEVRYRRRMS